MPVIEQIRNNSDIPISVDTTKAIIIKEALKFDVQIINDISSLGDSDSLNILRDKEVYICFLGRKNIQNFNIFFMIVISWIMFCCKWL